MAKVSRYRRQHLRIIEVARLRARDHRWPRTAQARWKAANTSAPGRAPVLEQGDQTSGS